MCHEIVEKRGFTIIPGVLTGKDIGHVIEELNHTPLPRSRAGARHALRHPAVAEVARDPRLTALAHEILGSSAIPYRATLFDKSPGANWLVVWHQDTALPVQKRQEVQGWGPWSVKEGVVYAHAPANALSQVLALRLHLDDSTLQNGPLRVLPGTHTMGVLGDDVIHQLAAHVPAVACVVPRGGVLAMRPLIVHSSSKSRTEAPRRVLHIEYAPSVVLEGGLQLAVA
jgi:ectoine hydroxylase-related dioxygenase (phytanoyl-CoA dioxygenase family)